MKEWSHLEQRGVGDRGGRGSGREWLHLEQRGVGDRVGRGSGMEWSHLEQRGGDGAGRGSVTGW